MARLLQRALPVEQEWARRSSRRRTSARKAAGIACAAACRGAPVGRDAADGGGAGRWPFMDAASVTETTAMRDRAVGGQAAAPRESYFPRRCSASRRVTDENGQASRAGHGRLDHDVAHERPRLRRRRAGLAHTASSSSSRSSSTRPAGRPHPERRGLHPHRPVQLPRPGPGRGAGARRRRWFQAIGGSKLTVRLEPREVTRASFASGQGPGVTPSPSTPRASAVRCHPPRHPREPTACPSSRPSPTR